MPEPTSTPASEHTHLLYAYIDEYEARHLAQVLAESPPPPGSTLVLRIHSPGGEVYSGFAMYHHLRQQAARGVRVVAVVEGLAASMATVVALAASHVQMANNARLMVHNPWTVTQGDGTVLRRQADALDALAQELATIYATKTGLSPDRLKELMNQERYLTAAEALELGLVDEVVAPVLAAAELPHAPRPLVVYNAYLEGPGPGAPPVSIAGPTAPAPTWPQSLAARLLASRLTATTTAPDDRSHWNLRQWEKQDPRGLARRKATDPTWYAALFQATYQPHAA